MKLLFKYLGELGEVIILTWKCVRALFKGQAEFKLTMAQLESAGVDSWSITLLTALFTGMVMAMQFSVGLEPFGASLYTPKLVGVGIVREMGPVLTALLVGGRVGAGFTAELGSMAVTEQIDALRALGADPVRKLVLPRVLAMVIAMPLLTVMADVIGCAGGIAISVLEVDATWRFAYKTMLESVWVEDLFHGLIKSLFFGYVIAIVGSWNGMRTLGGTEGVGRSTTITVVYTSIIILVADFFLTRMLIAVYA